MASGKSKKGAPPPAKPAAPTQFSPSDTKELNKQWTALRLTLIFGLPGALVQALIGHFIEKSIAQPYEVLSFVVPLSVAGWFTWYVGRRLVIGKAYWVSLTFFLLYCSIFTAVATSDLLVWKRMPFPHSTVARDWLMPFILGDLRYRIVPREPASKDLIVVLLDEPTTRNLKVLRQDKLAVLQRVTAAQRVHGLALDFFFEGASEVDADLCKAIRAAEKVFPVFSGYTIVSNEKDAIRPEKDALSDCLTFKDHLGYLVGLADIDGTVRTLPLHWRDDPQYPTLSARIVKRMAERDRQKIEIPDSPLLRFVAPSDDIPVYDLAKVVAEPDLLNDAFIIVGQKGAGDRFRTPFGEQYGTVIHAIALHSLRTGSYIRRPSGAAWGTAFYAACYGLLLIAISGAPKKRLILGAAVTSLAIVALSIAAIYFWRVWIDVIYALAGIWLFLPLILTLRKRLPATASAR